jgi:hypothetical protein
VEARLGPVQPLDPHVIGKQRVQTTMKIARAPGVGGLERDLLANGVDTGIGSPGGEDAPLGRQEAGERALHLTLDGAFLRLELPASERRAIVMDCRAETSQRKVRHGEKLRRRHDGRKARRRVGNGAGPGELRDWPGAYCISVLSLS